MFDPIAPENESIPWAARERTGRFNDGASLDSAARSLRVYNGCTTVTKRAREFTGEQGRRKVESSMGAPRLDHAVPFSVAAELRRKADRCEDLVDLAALILRDRTCGCCLQGVSS